MKIGFRAVFVITLLQPLDRDSSTSAVLPLSPSTAAFFAILRFSKNIWAMRKLIKRATVDTSGHLVLVSQSLLQKC